MGIVPSGTGCDLTRSLNIPRNLRNAIRFISEAPDQHIDLGRVTYNGPGGQSTSRYYLNIADFGLGGEVVKKVNEQRLKRRASSYIRCLAEVMLYFKGNQVRISVDGQKETSGNYLIGAFANGQVFGKGMKIAPLACLDDGLFDIILVKKLKFIELCLHGWKLISGSHLSHRKVSFKRGKRIQVTPLYPEPVLLELDGEQVGTLPALFEIIPQSFKTKGFIKNL